MSYQGYRLIINGMQINNDLIQKGTYEFTKEKRMPADWEDATKTQHQQIGSRRKVVISFSLRERNLSEQESVTGIFATQEDIPVTYWDDYDCSYKTGSFYMKAPKISHRNTIGGINYAATSIQLTEY